MTDKLQAPVVLVTRPAAQLTAFSAGCQKLGFSVVQLPCLQIIPCKSDQNLLQSLLNTHSTVLFTSANAVHHAHKIQAFPWPQMQVHAIGSATATTLERYQQALALKPQSPFNSEAYINQLANASPGSLLIIKGRGGRGLIQPALAELGWQVSTLDVYERVRPVLPADDIDALFTGKAPDIISVTSDEILHNLWHLCHQHSHSLRDIPLVVNSDRCAHLAADLGFRIPALVAAPAGDNGQLSCLAHWKNTVFDRQSVQPPGGSTGVS